MSMPYQPKISNAHFLVGQIIFPDQIVGRSVKLVSPPRVVGPYCPPPVNLVVKDPYEENGAQKPPK